MTFIHDKNTEYYTDRHIEQIIANVFSIYMRNVLLIIGTFGNLLSFLVFSQKPLCESVMSFYLRALALGDLTALWSFSLPFLTGTDLRNINNVTCWLLNSLRDSSMYFSVWVLSTITIERFVAVTFPHKLNIIFSHRRASISIGIFLFAAMCPTLNYFFSYQVIVVGYGERIQIQVCWIHSPSVYSVYIAPWVETVLYSIIPSVIITFCNVGIIYRVIKSRAKRVQQMNAQHDGGGQANMVATLVTISMAFLIFTLPTSIFVIFELHPFLSGTHYGTKRWSQMLLGVIICSLMYQMNHSLNFWLYVMSGTKFRNKLFAMLKYYIFCLRNQSQSDLSC